jgi:hypothetical protein
MASAWTKGLWHSHNLLLIGGDMEHPSDEESRIIGEIRQQIAAAPPGAQGRAVHLTGQDPETIQAVEAWLAVRRSSSVPNLYVAPSLKEEFGLAILEAHGCRHGGMRSHTRGSRDLYPLRGERISHRYQGCRPLAEGYRSNLIRSRIPTSSIGRNGKGRKGNGPNQVFYRGDGSGISWLLQEPGKCLRRGDSRKF